MLAWAWRIASRRGLGSVAARLAALLAALPVLAAALAGVPVPPTFAWPTVAGLGGAIGKLLASIGLAVGREVLGPVGALMIWTIGLGACRHSDAAGAGALGQRVARGRASRSAVARVHCCARLPMPSLGCLSACRRWLRIAAASAVVRREPAPVGRGWSRAMDEPPPVVAAHRRDRRAAAPAAAGEPAAAGGRLAVSRRCRC